MSNFEFALITVYYLFAWGYMAHSLEIDEYNTVATRLLAIIASMTIGVLYFPVIFAEDIWNKLNNEE